MARRSQLASPHLAGAVADALAPACQAVVAAHEHSYHALRDVLIVD